MELFFFFQAEDGIRDGRVTGVQTCALPISIRTAARRLEAAWLALEAEVAAERRRWDGEIEAVARWRLPLWPLLALWTPLAAALVWLGLVLGGYLPAPAWFAARLGF